MVQEGRVGPMARVNPLTTKWNGAWADFTAMNVAGLWAVDGL